MFEQDYLMKQIKEMIRAVLKILFNIDIGSATVELKKQIENKDDLDKLIGMVDRGDINEAENQIYEMISDHSRENLKIALFFYDYLNEKEDGFLQEHGFSRDEIKSGMKYLIREYGLTGIADMFLSDI